ncbi:MULTISPECIES: HAD family hydrolase [Streptomyces]|uniref:Haloacid dehalogenase-like hydrolase n=1 Tax=Streptomyces evansiae TaxID=3075535 RepID=A0ABU2R299_9ACTN|nr:MULTISPECIES: haloacid dehalogenase-like hydrolase [unclassified Streptomyces]MDT0409395.1 haloacid dehalogenase-like hydrolase [Streptomyces sp. DSM 41979]MYQ59735.1 HAD hydrolase-like protein [Streptomyces sp. SID4926]SCE60279.1 Phosphoglycolate phosphatase, HAD superfamily [Streptomyces sp. DfronAA-171]
MILVLWDIDRTLLYAGDTDRLVYREVFRTVVGRPATTLPAKGTGVTMPVAVRELLTANNVQEVDRLAPLIVARLPAELRCHRTELLRDGHLMPGAVEALAAARADADLVPSIVTGNLRQSAEIKLAAFGLTEYVDVSLGGYASDDPHRPALVRVAQARAERAHGRPFTRANTVIIGDSLQDVRTGREGGARVIGVASGTTAAEALADAGADEVLSDLTDPVRLLELIHARG